MCVVFEDKKGVLQKHTSFKSVSINYIGILELKKKSLEFALQSFSLDLVK